MFHPIYERLNQLCSQNGVDITNLCIEIKSSLSNKEKEASSGNLGTWKKGNFKPLELIAIKEKFNCSIDWLLTGVSENQSPTSQNTDSLELIELVDIKSVKDVRRNSKICIINAIISVMKMQKKSIKDLSIQTSIPVEVICSWFRGEAIPNSYEIQVLSLILDVSADYLVGHTQCVTTLTEVQNKDHFILQRPDYEIVAKYADKYGLILADKIFENVTKLFEATIPMEINKAIQDRVGMLNVCEGYMNKAGYDTERILQE